MKRNLYALSRISVIVNILILIILLCSNITFADVEKGKCKDLYNVFTSNYNPNQVPINMCAKNSIGGFKTILALLQTETILNDKTRHQIFMKHVIKSCNQRELYSYDVFEVDVCR